MLNKLFIIGLCFACELIPFNSFANDNWREEIAALGLGAQSVTIALSPDSKQILKKSKDQAQLRAAVKTGNKYIQLRLYNDDAYDPADEKWPRKTKGLYAISTDVLNTNRSHRENIPFAASDKRMNADLVLCNKAVLAKIVAQPDSIMLTYTVPAVAASNRNSLMAISGDPLYAFNSIPITAEGLTVNLTIRSGAITALAVSFFDDYHDASSYGLWMERAILYARHDSQIHAQLNAAANRCN